MPDLHISLLGGLEIGGQVTTGPPLTRKARAMLAYLALHSGQAQSREKLAALFWGRNPDSQARTNLRQTLSTLRRALPPGNGGHLLAEGDSIALDPNGVEIDVAQFEALAAGSTRAEIEQAVALYRGDLLDGFSLKEDAFEDWAGAERERLRILAVAALERLAADYAEAQDFGRSIQTALRLLALDPLREDIHRALMRAYVAQGRPGAALKQYEVCRDTLRRELGVEPEPETRRLFGELRAQRERPNGQATGEPATARGDMAKERSAEPRPTADVGLPLPDRPSVAVLPFENAGDEPDQSYFADGITENIIGGLTRFRELFVIGAKSSFASRSRATDIGELGRRLGVAHFVEGSVRRAGSRLRVTAQLIDAANGHRIWAEKYDRDLDDIFAVQDEITTVIVAALVGRLEDASRVRAAQKPVRDMAAYDLLLRARQLMRRYSKEGELAARRHLERAIEIDPGYAAAHAALALTYVHEYESPWSEAPNAARDLAYEIAQKAVALDENDSTAHRALSHAAHYCDRHELANKEIDRAIALNPNDYPNLCTKSWALTFSGQPEAALACLKEALRLNPFAMDGCLVCIGVAEFMAHRYPEAAGAFAQMNSWDPLRYACIAACHGLTGDDARARDAAARTLEAARREFSNGTADPIAGWRAYIERMFRFQSGDDWQHLREGLGRVGLPV